MKNSTINTIAAAALTLGAASTPVFATDVVGETVIQGNAVQIERIEYERGELATQAGRQTLERRIENAAERVCGSRDFREVGSLRLVAQNRACFDTAVNDALGQLDTAQLATID